MSPDAWEDVLSQHGLSLTIVAERSGVPRPTLSGLLGGYHRASVPITKQLAAALGCRPATLFPTLLPKFVDAEDVEAVA